MDDSVSSNISGGTFYGPVFMGRDSRVAHHGPMAPPVPRMLPFGPDGFVDREVLRDRLDGLLAGRDGQGAPLLVLLHGTVGVGKTGLLLHWAQQRKDAFPGGVFYADMSPQGLGDPTETAAVLESFIGVLGTPRSELPATEAALAARFRSLSAGLPSLVVLDGVLSAAQVDVERLLPGHPASMVVLTSRFRLGAIEGRLPVRLAVPELDEEACAELFRTVAGEDVPAGEALRTVLRASAGLPYVVRIAAARAADPASDGVEGLAARIARENILEALEMPRRLFDLAYEALDPQVQRGFRLLGVHPTPEFADALLDELAPGVRGPLYAAGLLERSGPRRSRLNGVVHGHAQILAAPDPSDVPRVIDWYLRRAVAAELRISGRCRAGALFAEPGPLTGVFRDKGEALEALEPDRNNLVAVAELPGIEPTQLCLLAEAVHGLFLDRGHHALWIRIARLAVDAASDDCDGLLLARMHFELAFALTDRGSAEDLDEARTHYDAARESARRTGGHARTESSALEGLGRIAVAQGDPQAAAELYGQALAALGDLEHPRGRALLAYHQGNAASAAGRHEQAAAHLAEALRGFLALTEPDTGNAAKTRLRQAMAHLAAGRPDEAVEPLAAALEAFAVPTLNRADAVLVRGDVRAALGDPAAARADWQEALELYGSLRSIRAEEARIRLARGGPEQAQG
ncbi:tetratricopeptide repeat protein [Streptomyces sp. NBC_01443]|uniref:tetratricopeptide repeat protein n=1 Tax=Streptomyces sp. NBC_01443 TaxID=2903868 RepID=UPI00225B1654|nr:tetratricopeptide repeat protein [Streptomyces sp. NBC_01443]MCX4629366.1 tetratricopeptide repeat protein [Streptomyces sp. NBC_01443]